MQNIGKYVIHILNGIKTNFSIFFPFTDKMQQKKKMNKIRLIAVLGICDSFYYYYFK